MAAGADGVGGGDYRSGKTSGVQFRAPRGRGRPPRAGRGRGRFLQGGRGGRELRGEGFEINQFAASRDSGDLASLPGIIKDRINKGKEPVEGSQSLAGKHKGSQVGEPIPKKKRNFILCCEICEDEHFTTHCPLLHGPKPTAQFSGLAGDGLGFFHIPFTKVAKVPQKVSATALIKIIEGSVPAELVKKELARAIPIKWDWEVCEHGNNSYIVPFPCQVELQRMISMMRLRTDNNEGVMLFEEWNNEIKPKQQLQKVWVQVYGVPYEIRSFLPLWAVGSILGVTQRVDMRYLKKTGVVRLMVAVLDVNCIPDDADIVVDDSLYEIFFKVDHIVPATGGEPDAFDEVDDLDPENQNKDQEMKDLDNHNKSNFPGHPNDTAEFNSHVNSTQAPNDKAPTAYEVQLVEGAIDKAVQNLLEDISASVVAEIDKSSDIYSAAPMQLDGPIAGERLPQENTMDLTFSDEVCDTVTSLQSKPLLSSDKGTPSFEHIAVLTHSNSAFGQSGEEAKDCNGANISVDASIGGQETVLPGQGSDHLHVTATIYASDAGERLSQENTMDPTFSDEVCDTVTSLQSKGTPSFEHKAVLNHPNSAFGQSGEEAKDCNGANISVDASIGGQETALPGQGSDHLHVTATIFASENQVREVSSGQQNQLVICGNVVPAVMKEVDPSTKIDFQALPRFALQSLCKQNGIRANISNLAMASALQDLNGAVGIEDLRASAMVVDVSEGGIAAAKTEDDKKNFNEETTQSTNNKNMVHLRRSQRSSAMRDEHTLKKVERRVAACNLELTGNFQGNILAAVLVTAAA